MAGLLSLAVPARSDPAPVRLPAGSHAEPGGGFVSSRGLRDTSDFLARQLATAGIVATELGPYRVRDAELTRFVSQTPKTAWLAIHVLRRDGKTLIFFVPRPSS